MAEQQKLAPRVERILSNAVDKDRLHRLIDELPDDGIALLCLTDEDNDTRWNIYGDCGLRETLGMVEAVKALIVHQWLNPCGYDDCKGDGSH